MPKRSLDEEVVEFLRREKGDLTYREFAQKVGMSKANLLRLQRGERGISLRKLQEIMDRLRVDLPDVFPGRYSRHR